MLQTAQLVAAFRQADTSLARQSVEAHGGRITAESACADKGSRFTVRLPLAK